MWQLVTLHNAGIKHLPWGNEEWRAFGPKHAIKRQALASLKMARIAFSDLVFSYRKVK